jgi:hypothetical protein
MAREHALRLLIPALLLPLLVGCPTQEEPPPPAWTVEVAGSSVTWDDATGFLTMLDAAGAPILLNATASVRLDSTGEDGLRLGMEDAREREVALDEVSTPLGVGDRLTITRLGEDGEPDLVWEVVGYGDSGAWTFAVELVNGTGGELALAKATALEIPRDRASGLFVGGHPSELRVLENGSYTVFDFLAEVRAGDQPAEPGWGEVVPGDFAGFSVSNWNHGIAATDGGPAWIAGALSMGTSSPVLNLSYEAGWAQADADGRVPFTYFAAEGAYEPTPKPIPSGGRQRSELYRVQPMADDLFVGLEDHAQALADQMGIVPWHRRAEGRRIPNGWNSWSGSGSTGGYGTGIDEALMLENLDVMADELRDWGFDWFQIDDGYQPFYGDWTWREDRFPGGPAWLTQQIRDRGLIPGLWLAPLTLDADSATAQAHPEWLAEMTPVGSLIVGDQEILDLTHPEVQQWLEELFVEFTQEWGFEWLKMDFAYYALFGTGFHDPTMTREEAWSAGMQAIRRGLGEDTFFMGVGGLGLNFEHLDSMRLTLDSMPIWDFDPEYGEDDHFNQQGLKPTVRTSGRRWYLQDRIWINHPDLMFFRSNPNDDTWPEVTHEEARAFAAFIGMSGGIVKLGDRLVDLEPESINVIRQLVPIHPTAARPLDVFEREYPELWWIEMTEPLDGYDEDYHLLGLFDWGSNEDLTSSPFTFIPDDGAPSSFAVDLGRIGAADGSWLAYEFWTGEFLGEVSGTLEAEVPSHDSRVVALRRPTGAPQFLGWNRQISMGGTVLEASDWDEAAGTLTLRSRVAAPTEFAPFEYSVSFYVPDGYELVEATPSGVALDGWGITDGGEVIEIRFVPAQTGALEVVLQF